MKKLLRWFNAKRHRWVALVLFVAMATISTRPVWHLFRSISTDVDGRQELAPHEVDDASRMNRTEVAEIWAIPTSTDDAEQQLIELLARARQDGLKVSIAGARHSMGGHTIYPGGISINMLPFREMELDEKTETLHVQSGATWSQVIEYLDQRGWSPAIMQSNDSFSIGGSISVNCHGWQYDRPPISSTVRSFRLLKADGEIVRCSRDENSVLFSLVLGGYGLFGVILDVDLKVIRNECYRLAQHLVPIDDALTTFHAQVEQQNDVRMVYARLNIVPDELFNEVVISVLTLEPNESIPELKQAGMVELRRAIFRGSEESDYGKKLRWRAETKLQPHIRGKLFSRNQLLNEGVEVFENRSAETTDILHEYFVPKPFAGYFVTSAREIIRRHEGDLLNVTVRDIKTDHDTFLRYADKDMFAFVMLFTQSRDEAGDKAMEAMTRELIDAAAKTGGRYYLPYRLHATQDQFRRCYPRADEFFAKKREYDPDELFQNEFYRRYGRQ